MTSKYVAIEDAPVSVLPLANESPCNWGVLLPNEVEPDDPYNDANVLWFGWATPDHPDLGSPAFDLCDTFDRLYLWKPV